MTRTALFFVLVVIGELAACGGRPAPAASAPGANASATAPSSAPSSSSSVAASSEPTPASGPVSESEARAFLAPRGGEEPAETTPMPGTTDAPAADVALLAKCSAAKNAALDRAKKLDMGKQLAAGLKAMEKVSK